LAFASDLNTGIYSPSADQLAIATNGVERVEWGTSEVVFNDGGANYDFRIEGDTNSSLFFVDASAEAVGIGTTAPRSLLSFGVADTTGTNGINLYDNTGNYRTGIGGSVNYLRCYSPSDGGSIQFGRLSTSDGSTFLESGRFDSSGRFLVGTSTARANFDNSTNTAIAQIETADANARLAIVRNNGTPNLTLASSAGSTVGSNTVVTSGWNVGQIAFAGSDGSEFVNLAFIEGAVDGTPGANDMPGRLVFSTCADGASSPTERMTLKNNGNLLLGTAGQVWDERFSSSTGSSTIVGGFYSSNASYTSSVIRAQAEAAAGTGWILFEGKRSGGISVVYVYGNGNLQNTNNSYGQISDEKLKENIVDANSQWSDLKGVRVRNFNFKDGETHRQIGVIAQELEQVSPGLVYETVDRDEDGNELGTTTKAVQYSVLYMKAVKALQEAMERIEQLEASNAAMEARLAALEGA
jgi:hypothetical protein